jgi:hypothetical protein
MLKLHAAFRKVCLILDLSPLSMKLRGAAYVVTCLLRTLDTLELAKEPYQVS